MSVLRVPATADVLLLYPAQSLRDQINLWIVRHPERQIETSFERSLPEIRKLLRNAGEVLVDATEDPSQATDAFLQAVACLGAKSVTMYTETMHDELELFVRMRGSLFVLGPLWDEQWGEFFGRLLRSRNTPVRQSADPRWAFPSHSPNRHERQRQRFTNRFSASSDWPTTDAN